MLQISKMCFGFNIYNFLYDMQVQSSLNIVTRNISYCQLQV